jgi:hypothetical protein
VSNTYPNRDTDRKFCRMKYFPCVLNVRLLRFISRKISKISCKIYCIILKPTLRKQLINTGSSIFVLWKIQQNAFNFSRTLAAMGSWFAANGKKYFRSFQQTVNTIVRWRSKLCDLRYSISIFFATVSSDGFWILLQFGHACGWVFQLRGTSSHQTR